ncbi:hypothetical protein AAZX31_11G046200 [Glycine max]
MSIFCASKKNVNFLYIYDNIFICPYMIYVNVSFSFCSIYMSMLRSWEKNLFVLFFSTNKGPSSSIDAHHNHRWANSVYCMTKAQHLFTSFMDPNSQIYGLPMFNYAPAVDLSHIIFVGTPRNTNKKTKISFIFSINTD